MAHVNENYAKLPGSYLFSDIAHKTQAYLEKHPDAHLIKMGIASFSACCG